MLALFVAAALAVIVVPGPSVLYVVSQSVGGGRKAGLVSTIGIAAGAIVHVAAATIGLSSLLASSAQAFAAVRYAGAAYLVYLGVRTLAGRDGGEASEPRTGRRGLVMRGALVGGVAFFPKIACTVGRAPDATLPAALPLAPQGGRAARSPCGQARAVRRQPRPM